MRSIFDFVIKPKKSRYNNVRKVGDKNLILNTEMQNHQYVSREATVLSTPTSIKTPVKVGDDVIVHHNVFRRWYNVRGEEKNSRNFINENTYLCQQDQMYLYKKDNLWVPLKGFCFVKPIVNNDPLSTDKEKPLVGILKYLGDDLRCVGLKENDLVGFSPNSEFEFIIERERLYRVLTNSITIKYEYQGQEEEYNPSWV